MNSDMVLEKVKTYIKLTKEYYMNYGKATGNEIYKQSGLTCGAILAKIEDIEKGYN